MTDDFWPDISLTEKIRTPHAILVEQANLLQAKTKGLLVGQVTRIAQDQRFINVLRIVAPSLNNYIYSVVRVTHGIALYPSEVVSIADNAVTMVANEGQFIYRLKQILTSRHVVDAITGLLGQIQADQDAKG